MKKVVINGKEVNVHDQFGYFQPNTHVDGDCVIRALCKATGWEWKKAYCFAFISTIKEQFMPNCKDGERIVFTMDKKNLALTIKIELPTP